MTHVFIERIYPATHETCQRCKRGPETQDHRYNECDSVGEVWSRVRFRLKKDGLELCRPPGLGFLVLEVLSGSNV